MELPDIQAPACLLFEPVRGWVLYSKGDTERRPMASLTKLQTGLLAAQLANLDSVVTLGSIPGSIGGSTGALVAGELFPVRELLYDVFLPSDNFAAYSLGQHIGTAILGAAPGAAANSAMVQLMNTSAENLGCTDTHYLDTHGYINRTNQVGHYTSANDMMMIAMEAYAQQALRDPMVRGVYTPVGVSLPKAHKWVQENYNVGLYPGCTGCKEGWVPEIGQSLAMFSQRGNSSLISVTLQWPVGGVYQHGRDLHDWGYILLGETAQAESVIEETAPSVSFVGTWSQSGYFPTFYSDGYARFTSTVGAYCQLPFRATGIDWIGATGATRGKADVYIDDVLQRRVTATAITSRGMQTLFSVDDLPYTDHTIKVVAQGSGIIDIDAFRLRAHL